MDDIVANIGLYALAAFGAGDELWRDRAVRASRPAELRCRQDAGHSAFLGLVHRYHLGGDDVLHLGVYFL